MTIQKMNSPHTIDPAKVAALSRLFKIFNQSTGRKEPFVLTPTQQEIFTTIVTRSDPRVHVMCYTQFGKSETVACAVLLRAILFPEKWAIIAPTIPKTMIIMKKIIEHIFDDQIFQSQLDITDSLDRLRKERSKSRLTFKGGGEIFILSADTKNKKADGETLMGHGCFTGDAKILTEFGEFSMKEFIEKKLPLRVVSYNEKTGTHSLSCVLSWQTNSRGKRRMFSVKTKNSSFVCTEDHPVFTSNSWKKASDLVVGDQVLLLDKTLYSSYHNPYGEHTLSRLWKGLLCKAKSYGREAGHQILQYCLSRNFSSWSWKSWLERFSRLPVLQKGIPKKGKGEGGRTEILQSEMHGFREAEGVSCSCELRCLRNPSSKGCCAYPRTEFLRQEMSREVAECICLNGKESKLEGGERESSLACNIQQEVEKKDKRTGWFSLFQLFFSRRSACSPHRLSEGELRPIKSGGSLRTMSWEERLSQRGMAEDVIVEIREVPPESDTVYNVEVEGNHNYFIDGVLTHNSPNICIDESALIPDTIYTKIKRMLGGQKDTFLLEIGNSFYRNHFHKSFHSPRYKKIFCDWRVGVAEGRLQESFVNEMRSESDFDVLYECKFPEADAVDRDGWSSLILETDLVSAFREEQQRHTGERWLGVDPSGHGDNFSTWVLRSNNHAELLLKLQDTTLPEIIGTTIDLATRFDVEEDHISLDSTGNTGMAEMLVDKGWAVRGINVAEKADDTERYINKRAEMAFRLQKWMKSGGTIRKNEEFYDMLDIKYKISDSSGKWKLMSKDEMRTRGIVSPDVFDALCLTFPDSIDGGPRFSEKIKRMERVRAGRTSFE